MTISQHFIHKNSNELISKSVASTAIIVVLWNVSVFIHLLYTPTERHLSYTIHQKGSLSCNERINVTTAYNTTSNSKCSVRSYEDDDKQHAHVGKRAQANAGKEFGSVVWHSLSKNLDVIYHRQQRKQKKSRGWWFQLSIKKETGIACCAYDK